MAIPGAPRGTGQLLVVALIVVVAGRAGVDGRLLYLQQADQSSGGDQSFFVVEEQSAQQTSDTGTFFFSPIVSSPFAWLQQQLTIVDALQRAAMQRMEMPMSANSYPGNNAGVQEDSQEELLRQVGCARLRAALMDRAGQQLPALSLASASSSSNAMAAGASASNVLVASRNSASEADGEEEYYEDYETGQVVGRSAYAQTAIRKATTSSSSNAANAFGDEVAGRIVRLLESAYTLAYGDEDVAALETLARTREAMSSSSSASASASGLSSSSSRGVVIFQEAYEGYYDAYGDEYEDDDEYEEDDEDEDDEYEDDDDYGEVLSVADAVLTQLESLDSRGSTTDDLDEEWADYLERAYEHYEAYAFSDEDEDQDRPSALTMLSNVASLVAWSRTGNMVVQLWPSSASAMYEAVDEQEGAGAGGQQELVLLAGEPFQTVTMAAVFDFSSPELLFSLEPVVVEDDLLYISLFQPDGSLNWGLVTLCILAAGTAAMLVGFLASFLSLRRTVRCRWVYVPRQQARYARAAACKGGDSDSDLDKPLILMPDEAEQGPAAGLQHASLYVPPVAHNESVAKALYR